MGHKGYYGQYTGNAKWSKNHADTKVTKSNYKASERDDAAHIDYLKRDVDYDNKHGHSDKNMTADEKHISKLAGDMKYDKEHHGSPAKQKGNRGDHSTMTDGEYSRHLQSPRGKQEHGSPAKQKGNRGDHSTMTDGEYSRHLETPRGKQEHGSPAKHDSASGRSHIHTKYHTSYEGDATFPKDKKKNKKVVSGTHTSDSNKQPIIDKETGKRLPRIKKTN